MLGTRSMGTFSIYNICKEIMHLLASRAWKFFTATLKCIYNESFVDVLVFAEHALNASR